MLLKVSIGAPELAYACMRMQVADPEDAADNFQESHGSSSAYGDVKACRTYTIACTSLESSSAAKYAAAFVFMLLEL